MRVASRVVLATALLAGTVVAPALPASSLAPAWSVDSSVSPPGPPNGTFGSVACATDTTCFAVGNTVDGGVLLEQWNGTDWSIVPPPETGVLLYDIACPSATSCFAVGFVRIADKDTPTIESWDGTTWSAAPNPEIEASAALESIACATPTRCFAVGRAGQNLIEQWDGATWSIVASPAKSKSSYFVGVACASSTDCSAVGISYDGSYSHPLTEHWNGTAWSIVASLDRTSNSQPTLNAVSCIGAQSCFAVGSVEVYSTQVTKTLIEHWNGAKWSIVASPSVSGAMGSSLADVSCPTTTSCFAVGSSDTTALIERWNGTNWSIGAGASPDPNRNNLNGVACRSSTSCVAVGSGPSVTGPAVIERWNGTRWALEPHPMPMPPSSTLSAVSCRGETCFAVGQYTNPEGSTVTLVERSDASGWSVVPSPNVPGATQNGLEGVSCASATFCFAVGSTSVTESSATKTLVQRWNGSKWLVVPSPNHGRDASDLASVSCTSATSCFAVGAYANGSSGNTLIERWNGSTWSVVPSPNRAPSPHVTTRSSRLAGVSCATATSCFAVGSDADDTRGPFLLPTETLVERWSGSAWSIAKSPNPGRTLSIFHGVSCPSTKTCFAVGEFFTSPAGGGPSQSLIARWNGTAWTRVVNTGPAPAGTSPLNGVSCSNPTSCFAVGNAYSSQWSTFVKTLAGSTWSNVPSPNAADGSSSHLQAVSCSSEARCYAVGYSGQYSALQHTLVESYS